MAWTYSADDLATGTASGQLNVVRLLIGDTDTLDQQVQDAEVEFALAQSNANVYSAGAWCAKAIASKYARKVTTQLDGALSADYSDLQTHYNALAATLEDQARLNGARLGVFAGGINKTTMETGTLPLDLSHHSAVIGLGLTQLMIGPTLITSECSNASE